MSCSLQNPCGHPQPKERAPVHELTPRPLVGVTCCLRQIADASCHTVFDKYLTAIVEHAHCNPVLIPALGDGKSGGRLHLESILKRLDGLLLTGSRSMVGPETYGGPPSPPSTLHDRARDATALPLVRLAVEFGTPVFAICRGFQELCVAFGSRLHQDLRALNSGIDHSAKQGVGDEKYLPSHEVICTPGGYISAMLADGASRSFPVNSLHRQGIASVEPGLVVEAVSTDGLIEAVRLDRTSTFTMGVQWHPEWHTLGHTVNSALFQKFGEACETRMLAQGLRT